MFVSLAMVVFGLVEFYYTSLVDMYVRTYIYVYSREKKVRGEHLDWGKSCVFVIVLVHGPKRLFVIRCLFKSSITENVVCIINLIIIKALVFLLWNLLGNCLLCCGFTRWSIRFYSFFFWVVRYYEILNRVVSGAGNWERW